MNIFIINHYAGSPEIGMEYRPYYLAKEWIKLGHNVVILAASFSHLRKKNIELQNNFTEQNIDEIKYIWINTPKYEGNGVGRIKNMFVFIKKTLYKSSYFAEKYKPDVVIASSTYPSDNYVAKKISKLSKAKFIYEVHDLWPLSPMELGGMKAYHPFIVAMQHAENFAYKKADAVISMLPNTKEHMKNHGLDLKKWNYIPNGIVVDDWGEKSYLNQTYKDTITEIKKKKFLIGYTGGHAISNSLNTIIDAAKIIEKLDESVYFILVGNGTEKENLINKAKELKNIKFLDTVSKEQIPELLSLMDILIITWNKSKLYRFGINPNKIFDYMMASKPIIHATDAPNNFVDEAHCGIATEPENPKSIVDAILKIKSMPQSDILEFGANGKKFVLSNYDYSLLAKKYIEIINKN